MKIGLGLYRHMLTRDYYDFARQAGCTHVVVHLVDYLNQGATNPSNNQPTGAKYEPGGPAGDADQISTTRDVKKLRGGIEGVGRVRGGSQHPGPAHWRAIVHDGAERQQLIQ